MSGRKKALYTLGIVCVILGITALSVAHVESSKRVAVNAMQFEIVTTPAVQERGLGGRASIPHDYGMLFVFPKPGAYGFWMKNMQASIDILWLTDKGEVITIKADVSPATYPEVFYPGAPASFVLETAAGEAARKRWVEGSVIPLPS